MVLKCYLYMYIYMRSFIWYVLFVQHLIKQRVPWTLNVNVVIKHDCVGG